VVGVFLASGYEYVLLDVPTWDFSLTISVEEDNEWNDDSIPSTDERTKLLLLLR
jgi:hypothetical protein